MSDAYAAHSKGFSDSNRVHFAAEIDSEIALTIVETLQHFNPAKGSIIKQDESNGQVQAGDSREFCARHAERAIAHQTDDALMRSCKSCSNRGWQCIAQATMSTRNDNGASSAFGTK